MNSRTDITNKNTALLQLFTTESEHLTSASTRHVLPPKIESDQKSRMNGLHAFHHVGKT